MLIKCDSSFFLDDKSLSPLSDKELEEHEDKMEDWLQKAATVHDILYATVDQSTFYQIKGEPTAAAVWKKLTLIHGNKGAMFESDLLAQLQNFQFSKNGETSMQDHLANLVVLKEQLTEIDCPLLDASFASYICTSLSLTPSYKLLLITLTTNAHVTNRPISSEDLIWHINEEANSATIESSIN
ncbi:hypothetical protein C0989_000949 [Termitomyces sp. Mn162]|nr:hypothetical protein C0989_000949 [Termitomyces sp. Mn162]